MIPQMSKTVKIVAVLMTFAVSQAYVSANLVKRGIDAVNGFAHAQGERISGRVITSGNRSVTVNGNSVQTGETFFSGQQITTPAATGATIQLGSLGSVDIAPGSSLTVTFERGSIRAVLTSGCAIMRTNQGTTGSMEAQGRTEQTDPANAGSIDTCTGTTPGAPPVFGQGAASAAGAGAGGGGAAAAAGGATVAGAAAGSTATAGGFGTATAIGLAGAAGLITASAVINTPCRRGRNLSPGTPRGRNDECRRNE